MCGLVCATVQCKIWRGQEQQEQQQQQQCQAQEELEAAVHLRCKHHIQTPIWQVGLLSAICLSLVTVQVEHTATEHMLGQLTI
jgi:hypothetical protein